MYEIEVKVESIWCLADIADDLSDALIFASIFCENRPEEQVRIKTPEGKIL